MTIDRQRSTGRWISLESDVLILVVTYNGADTIRRTLLACRSDLQIRTSPVLVIDNASGDDTVPIIESLDAGEIEVKKMPGNLGVAAAFNAGIQRAVQRGAKWLFILDQDSVCDARCLDILLQSAGELMDRGEKVGAVCPTARSRTLPGVIFYPYHWTGRGFTPVTGPGATHAPDRPVSVDSTISSGALYRVEALASAGGFREEYFIDFVDHECHMRLRRDGWTIWWERSAELHHRLGKIQRMTDDGPWIEHEPFRYYYMARNMLDGLWRLGGAPALFRFAAELYGHVRRIRRHAEGSDEIIRYILKGLKDGFLRRTGPLDPGDRF
ncbi:MAG: glycosyltransferase [Desulfobacterales bacterium]|nr:glycosyltransferase [Desulfobacterales bacterium]